MNAVIKFTPAPQSTAEVIEHNGGTVGRGYTKLDNATDLQIIAALPNALVKPYLFLISKRSLRMKMVHWGEVAAFCGRGQAQTFQALKQLADLGLAQSDSGLWRVTTGNTTETRRIVAQKPVMAVSKNAVPHGVQMPPELSNEVTKRNKDKTLVISEPANLPSDARSVTADAAVREPSNSQTLSASTGSDLELTGQARQTSNAHGVKHVPPRRAAAQLLEVWNAHRGNLPAADTITPGREKGAARLMLVAGSLDAACVLLADAAREVAADSYWQDHRYGLDNLMPGKVVAKAEAQRARKCPSLPAQGTTAGELDRFAPGMRVRYPDGSEALVVSVQARSISTDHPQVRDVPLSQCRNLEVLA